MHYRLMSEYSVAWPFWGDDGLAADGTPALPPRIDAAVILAFDAVEKRPVVIDDAIAIRHRVYLSLSWDHRVIDGALASQFLGRVKQNLETWDFAEDLGL